MMDSKIEELRNLCLEKLNNKDQLTKIQSDISFKDKFEELDETEREKFTLLCDNRIDCLKAFRESMTIIAGFVLVVLSIYIPKVLEMPKFENLEFKNLVSVIIVVLSLIFVIYQFCNLWKISNQIKSWTAFKEMALMKIPKK